MLCGNINNFDLEGVLDFNELMKHSYRCNWKPKDYPQQHNWTEPKKGAVLYKTFPFGKYKGWKIKKVIEHDRPYVNWFIKNVKFKELTLDIQKQIPLVKKGVIEKEFLRKTITRKVGKSIKDNT
jgi:uncharacterized protein (DUF3820 family)